MDEIKNSDKFNHLRLNIKGSNRVKSNTNLNENLIKNITGIKGLKDQPIKSTTLRQSPRRRPETKRFDFGRLHCSINTKNDNKNQNPITKSGPLEETVGNSYRNDPPPSVPLQKRPPFIERLERDASGFLKPSLPAPKKNNCANHVEEEMKTFNSLMLRLTDPTIFREVETVYHSAKIFNHIKKTACKLMMKSMPYESTPTDNTNYSSFQSSRGIPDVSSSRMDINKSKEIFSHLSDHSVAANSKNNIYLLRNWGVIKGSGKKELMVTGMLIDSWSRKVIELNHTSSCIIEKPGNNCVRTVCCSYQLCGKFLEDEHRLPPEIKQFFINDNFPDNWELVAAKWHSLNLINSLANSKNIINKNVPNKRSLKDLLCKNEDNTMIIKKLKPNNNRFLHETNVRGRTESASVQSALNLSVQTRSAVRKNRLPIFL